MNGDPSPSPEAFLDTNVLIDVGRRLRDAIACVEATEQRGLPAISSVVEMELLVGCRDRVELRQLERILRRYWIAPVTEPISDRATALLRRYRLSHGLQIADAMIAATALVHSLPLVSQNRRDFRFIEGLIPLPYPNPFPDA